MSSDYRRPSERDRVVELVRSGMLLSRVVVQLNEERTQLGDGQPAFWTGAAVLAVMREVDAAPLP